MRSALWSISRKSFLRSSSDASRFRETSLLPPGRSLPAGGSVVLFLSLIDPLPSLATVRFQTSSRPLRFR